MGLEYSAKEKYLGDPNDVIIVFRTRGEVNSPDGVNLPGGYHCAFRTLDTKAFDATLEMLRGRGIQIIDALTSPNREALDFVDKAVQKYSKRLRDAIKDSAPSSKIREMDDGLEKELTTELHESSCKVTG